MGKRRGGCDGEGLRFYKGLSEKVVLSHTPFLQPNLSPKNVRLFLKKPYMQFTHILSQLKQHSLANNKSKDKICSLPRQLLQLVAVQRERRQLVHPLQRPLRHRPQPVPGERERAEGPPGGEEGGGLEGLKAVVSQGQGLKGGEAILGKKRGGINSCKSEDFFRKKQWLYLERLIQQRIKSVKNPFEKKFSYNMAGSSLHKLPPNRTAAKKTSNGLRS